MKSVFVIRDRIGRYVFIPISRGLVDCCGIVKKAVKPWSRK